MASCRADRNVSRLNEMIDVAGKCLASTSLDHPKYAERSVLLTPGLLQRTRRTPSIEDQDAAIKIIETVISASLETDPLYPHFLSNLAHVLETRFAIFGDMYREDLGNARKAIKRALTLTEPSGPEYPQDY
jgi:hypothetical protein